MNMATVNSIRGFVAITALATLVGAPCAVAQSKGNRVEGRYAMTQRGDTMTVVAVGRKLGACDPAKPALPVGK
jgi:hypothetical protein